MKVTFVEPIKMNLGLYAFNISTITGTKTTLKGRPAYKIATYECGSLLPCYSSVTAQKDSKATFRAICDAVKKAREKNDAQASAQEIACLLSMM